MRLDRWIALVFLTISLIYGFAAFNYPLLPFERNMVFLPNTLPIALSVLGVVVSLILLFSRGSQQEDAESGMETYSSIMAFNWLATSSLIGAMILYALLLRPIGFMPATFIFLAGCGILLGERKLFRLTMIAAIASFSIWYLVQQTLGIYLSPWPIFLNL